MKQTDTTKIEIENFLEVLEEFFEWCESGEAEENES